MDLSYKQPKAKRSLGQNFLVDDSVIDRIVGALGNIGGVTVVEIGPGRGALTERILDTGAILTAIEKDTILAAELREDYKDRQNFQCVESDVLQVDFVAVIPDAATSPVKLIGNLPYNISTAILERIAAERELFSQAVFMFQREVVNRIIAKPGDSERGYYTVLVEAAFDGTHLFDVPPTAFKPQPKVWSSVVSLTPKPHSVADELSFRKLVAAGFAQKRKNILNNLKHSMADAAVLLANASIDPRRRAETLTLEEWLTLYELANKNGRAL